MLLFFFAFYVHVFGKYSYEFLNWINWEPNEQREQMILYFFQNCPPTVAYSKGFFFAKNKVEENKA